MLNHDAVSPGVAWTPQCSHPDLPPSVQHYIPMYWVQELLPRPLALSIYAVDFEGTTLDLQVARRFCSLQILIHLRPPAPGRGREVVVLVGELVAL